MLTRERRKKKELKDKVLKDAREFYNELYYIYKDKYNEKINSLDTKNRKELDYKKLRLSDNYLYSSEEEQEKQDEKTTKADPNEFNEWINKKEAEINR